jgi:hypothetical protein
MSIDPASGQSEDGEQDDGLAALDLLELPAALYRIMRLMLRRIEMDLAQLWELIESLPEEERLTRAEVEEALRSLIEQRLLEKTDGTGPATYKVNFRRKIGNARSPFPPRTRKGSHLPQGIWDALDSASPKSPLPDSDDEVEA